MHSIRSLVKLSSDYLQSKGVKHARKEAEELLAVLLKRSRLELYFDYDTPIEEAELAQYREWIRRRGKREPFSYITGYVDFLSCKLSVSQGVLIPRQETEVLATRILDQLSTARHVVWDLCTGSGCLGLSLKKKRPDLEVYLSDSSEVAIQCATNNARMNALDVHIMQGDFLAPFKGKQADIVVCNPPYITEEEYLSLEDEVRLYEPREALVGGLNFYERLAIELPHYLLPHAKIFLEIGAKQAQEIEQIFHQSHWEQKRCEKDWAGLDRFFFLEYQQGFE